MRCACPRKPPDCASIRRSPARCRSIRAPFSRPGSSPGRCRSRAGRCAPRTRYSAGSRCASRRSLRPTPPPPPSRFRSPSYTRVTRYRIVQRFRAHTLVRVELETGRTHQIRVHLAHVGFPVVGDPLYAGRRRLPAGCTPVLTAELQAFPRQALHAARLKLKHPATGRELAWEAPVPEDLQRLLAALEAEGS